LKEIVKNNSMKITGVQGKRLELILHIAAWTVLFFIPVYLFSLDTTPDAFFMARVYLRTFIFAILFYINYFLLVPRLLFRQKKIAYYITAIALIAGLYFINSKSNDLITDSPGFRPQREEFEKIKKEYKFMPKHPWRFDVYNFMFTSILISGVSIGLRMAGRYNENEKKRKELEKEMLNSELTFLKNQISPHFFFNTLNNIYALTEINTDDAQKAILQLSKLMRYMLYESEQGNSLLSKEIDFMQNYIELMKLRLSDKVELQVKFPEKFEELSIPPLLFIPFIENAFKHGISYREASFIHISLETQAGEISFSCKNSMGTGIETPMKENSGIGLENVRKRLALLFPGKHTLGITSNEGIYSVVLTTIMNQSMPDD
jgi:two-component system, LytTR family, sensor kinase